ncbi:MAG: RNA methyltransferase [Anaerolineae bacterium]|nr:RNA methyltransferase [Anaerolineae bacterium]
MKPIYRCEAEVTEGLEFISAAELRRIGATDIEQRRGEIGFQFSGELARLLSLRTVQSVSLVQAYPVPRPRALLSNEYLPLLIGQIEAARRLSPPDAYRTFVIAAAGSDSSVMQRIRTTIAEKTGLAFGSDKGDLWIRIRPGAGSQVKASGWETLVRLTPRPLVTRPWRICNLEGALNAATAHAMIELTRPQPADVFLNLGCGSGTLMIERLAHSPCELALGIDLDSANLRCARANIDASGSTRTLKLLLADMALLPVPADTVSALCADLPFGQLSGSHAANQQLYPKMLAEAARVARSDARFVLITHEVRLMESLLRSDRNWLTEREIRVNLRGLHPRIYVLRRSV